jgi:hypothetical protein
VPAKEKIPGIPGVICGILEIVDEILVLAYKDFFMENI